VLLDVTILNSRMCLVPFGEILLYRIVIDEGVFYVLDGQAWSAIPNNVHD